MTCDADPDRPGDPQASATVKDTLLLADYQEAENRILAWWHEQFLQATMEATTPAWHLEVVKTMLQTSPERLVFHTPRHFGASRHPGIRAPGTERP